MLLSDLVTHKPIIMHPHSDSLLGNSNLYISFWSPSPLKRHACGQANFAIMYGTDHAQRHIHSHSRICLRLNNYQKKAWHLFRSRESLKHTQGWILVRKTGGTPFFLVNIKLRANLRTWANATLRVICTICHYSVTALKQLFTLQYTVSNQIVP